MTTIAYRNGVMAGDTAGNIDTTKTMEAVKVHKLNQGWVMGFAGTLCFMQYIVSELKGVLTKGAPPTNLLDLSGIMVQETDGNNDTEDCMLLLAHRQHGCYLIELTRANLLMATRLEDGYHAIGNGAPIAFGALHHGATAREAVEAAITHDHCTGGHVVEVSV